MLNNYIKLNYELIINEKLYEKNIITKEEYLNTNKEITKKIKETK